MYIVLLNCINLCHIISIKILKSSVCPRHDLSVILSQDHVLLLLKSWFSVLSSLKLFAVLTGQHFTTIVAIEYLALNW